VVRWRRRAGRLLCVAGLAPAALAGTWVRTGEGDCPGVPWQATPGGVPDATLCTPATAGRVALCFTQGCNPGCNYLEARHQDCREGPEPGRIYTCRGDDTER
jgi:hypothetical protein